VYSPHAADNPQLGLSRSQLRGSSGLLTVQLDAVDVEAVERFCDGLQRFLMTVSWGGYESLAFPVCAVHAAGAPMHPVGGASLDMVRLSIGLEDAELLIADLDVALARL
jgi:cystathionine beta-lyase/cystathionine gamma-synthase